ncbi:MAG: hypothetical protein HY897_14425 [Deltaproteobacteria bacterium]|nr:hypothetical protein [Deltaproteobacteria bacterium]
MNTRTVTLITLLGAAAANGCSSTDGARTDLGAYYRSCESDYDCQPFGYCNDEHNCAADCRATEDCYLYGEGKVCANCRCLEPAEVSEDSIEGCPEELTTATDWKCTYRPPEECALHHWTQNCSDRDCVGHGWANACSEEGMCVGGPGVDFGTIDTTKNAAAYVGVWAELETTAVRTTGLPLVPYQDTVSVLYMLTRMKQDGEKVVKTSKLCYNQIMNFKGDQILEKDVAYMLTPKAYLKNTALIEQVIGNPPALAAGAAFSTTRFWEVRGAYLNDPSDVEHLPRRSDYLACREQPDAQACVDSLFYDQDGDGEVAMTTILTGVLNVEIYSVMAWSTLLNGTVVDGNHLKGFVDFSNTQYEIDASDPNVIYETQSAVHEDADRSYFRMARLADGANCDDVLAEKDRENGWLNLTPHLDDRPDP